MNKILSIKKLSDNVNEYVFDAPLVARHAKPGQFVILRVDNEGERVPFTICDMDKQKGTITLLIQTVGYTTMKLSKMKPGDYISDFVGPLGNPSDLVEFDKVLLVGGGIGTAVTFPQCKALAKIGKKADCIVGARNKSLIMYEDEFKKYARRLYIVTDDGSYGEKGLVTDKMRQLFDDGNKYDVVFAVGPLIMMKFVSKLAKEYNIPSIVSMNSVMVDGTGMCGCCRLTVGGQTKYACVEGPEFDGSLVDFDEAILRARFYKQQEENHVCKLRGTANE